MCLLVPKQHSSSLNWDSSRPRGDGRDGRGCFPQPGNCKTKGRPSGSSPFPGSGRGRSPQPRGWIPLCQRCRTPRGHRPGDIAPCSRHLLPSQRRGSSICQPVYPPAPGWLQLPSWILHPAHGRSGSAPASSYRRLTLGQLSFQHHFLAFLRLQEEVVSFSCVKELELP